MKETPRRISPDEEPHDGEPVVPRPAATVVVLRDGEETLEVLMVQRHHDARFMGGVWVFPGGAVDQQDGIGDDGVRSAAVRELYEEAGIELADPSLLVTFARWITPPESRRRFDTWFFLAPVPAQYTVKLSAGELIAHRWVTPSAALEASQSGEMPMVFPTIRTLQSLLPHRSTTAAFAELGDREVHPLQPRVVGTGGQTQLVLPGDPGYPI